MVCNEAHLLFLSDQMPGLISVFWLSLLTSSDFLFSINFV